LVAIAKPAGVSLATSRRAPGEAVGRLLESLPLEERDAYGLAADCLYLVHRLDVSTSGVLLLARDPDAHRRLVAAFAARDVEKTYLGVVWGQPRPASGRWEWAMGPDRADRRRMRVDGAGRAAITEYRLLGRGPHASLVSLHPLTGRTHQLRVHLAHAGHPIVGDDLYAGAREHGVGDRCLRRLLAPGRALLHAWRLKLPADPPFEELIITAPLPADFARVLAGLGIDAPG
jgi:23S rRNA pseudouridine1911/1915/1917 synthase